MTRPKRLTEKFIKTVQDVGVYGDGRGGHGLQLRVTKTGAGHLVKRFRQHTRIAGRPTQISLGWWPAVTLTEARAMAMENRVTIMRGGDPRKVVRRNDPAPPSAPVPAGPTFGEVAEDTFKAKRQSGWASSTEARWRRDLDRHLLPRLGGKRVAAVTSRDILKTVSLIWAEKPTVGAHVLRIAGAVFARAIAGDYRESDPCPAVRNALPKHRKPTKHHDAVPVTGASEAFAKIGACNTRKLTRLALQFIALTVARSNEVVRATWEEIDLAAAVWIVPAARSKTRREHRVPLSEAALKILRDAGPKTSGLTFPNSKGGPLTRATLGEAQRRCGVNATPHGWRSTFRSWAAETGVANEVGELSLGHVVGGVKGAYQRSDLLEQRRACMASWAEFVTG